MSSSNKDKSYEDDSEADNSDDNGNGKQSGSPPGYQGGSSSPKFQQGVSSVVYKQFADSSSSYYNPIASIPLPPIDPETMNYNIQMNYHNSLVEQEKRRLNVLSKF